MISTNFSWALTQRLNIFIAKQVPNDVNRYRVIRLGATGIIAGIKCTNTLTSIIEKVLNCFAHFLLMDVNLAKKEILEVKENIKRVPNNIKYFYTSLKLEYQRNTTNYNALVFHQRQKKATAPWIISHVAKK